MKNNNSGVTVYIVEGYVPYDSAHKVVLATLDKTEAEDYLKNHNPPDADEYYPGWLYEIAELNLHGVNPRRSSQYTYKITTQYPENHRTYWRGKKRTVHGTLNRAVLIYQANDPYGNEVTVERAPVGEYELFDMEAHLASK